MPGSSVGWGAPGQDSAAPPWDAGAQWAASRHWLPSPAVRPSSSSLVARTPTQGKKPDPPGWQPGMKPLAFHPRGVFPADARWGWGRRPVVREPRVLRPCGGFCETGWNGRPRCRHICWAGGPGIWDIVFLAGSGGCQKPDKLITSDTGQSSFWRARAGPPELPSGDDAAATQKFTVQRGQRGEERVLMGLGGGSGCGWGAQPLSCPRRAGCGRCGGTALAERVSLAML